MAMDQLKLTNEPHNIFDHIRSSSKGIIDCIQTDFTNFLPEDRTIDTRFKNWKPIIGEHFGFYHSGSLFDKAVLDSFDRKIERFAKHCNSEKRCIFVRTCVIPDYAIEMDDMRVLAEEIQKKYPRLQFIILFIVPEQEITAYHGNISDKIFVFRLDDRSQRGENLGSEYRNIFEFVFNNNLFETIPLPSEHSKITPPTTHLCLVDDIPAVRHFETLCLSNK